MPGPDRALGRPELAARLRLRLNLTWSLTIATGSLLVFAFVAFLAPVHVAADEESHLRALSAIVGAAYLPLSLVVGTFWGRRWANPTWEWFEAGRPPDASERDDALRIPVRFAMISAVLWSLAAVIFGAIQLSYSVELASTVFDSILLGGVTTCALGYLLSESVWRPVVAAALADNPPSEPVTPGVRARLTMAWALATGVPLIGIFAVASAGLLGADIDQEALWSTMFLVVTAVGSGLLATYLVSRSVSDPVAAVRSALARVEQGQLEVEVPVDDGSEIGLLQAGFNRMAGGLRERELLREIFGRQVGQEVARAALDREVALGGEEREVAVLFVDLVGSTALASEREPAAVVEVLNSFFAIVVLAVEERGGWVNKFEGDAALCVFGAPGDHQDPAGAALCAARNLRDRLVSDLPLLDAGIGVSAGRAVAGNIGTEQRYEYTVIGDPVNEAARLCDLAKRRPERLLASDVALAKAAMAEARHWTLGEDITLRGRSSATRLATAASS
jgi:adenylate cyclase